MRFTRHPPEASTGRSPFRDSRQYSSVIASVSAVLAGSPALAEYARQYNGNVHLIPTTVDTEAVKPHVASPRQRLVLGWIGSWSTSAELSIIKEIMLDVADTFDVEVLYVGAVNAEPHLPDGVPGEVKKWSLAEQEEFFRTVDIGLMPLATPNGTEASARSR